MQATVENCISFHCLTLFITSGNESMESIVFLARQSSKHVYHTMYVTMLSFRSMVMSEWVSS